MLETRVRSLGREDPLEKKIATHPSTLAWKIPWTEEPCRLQSVGSQRVDTRLRDLTLLLVPILEFHWEKSIKVVEICIFFNITHICITVFNIYTYMYELSRAKIIYYYCCYYCSVTQPCLTLCDPVNCSRPGLPVIYILLYSIYNCVAYIAVIK